MPEKQRKEQVVADVGQKVRVKEGGVVIDAVPYGPGTYDVVKDEDADPGNNLTAEQAKRATRKQSTGEVVEEKSSKGGKA